MGSFLISLIMMEVVLRVISPPSPFSPYLPLRPNNRMQLEVNLEGCSPVAFHSTNKWGFRGDEPPREWEDFFTIIAIGGSTTQCYYLDDKKTWPWLLQEKLKSKTANNQVWVGNGGLDGHSTRGHVIFMEEVISKLKPDAVILLVGLNDLGNSISEDRYHSGNPSEKTSWKYKIFASVRLIQILRVWKQIIFDDAVVVQKGGHGNYTRFPFSKPEMQFPADLKELLPGLNEFRKNVKKIIDLGRSTNTRICFLTQPLLFSESDYWTKIEGQFYWIRNLHGKLSAATYWKLLNIYNEELISICASENIDCIDLAKSMTGSDAYFYDSAHFNEHGADFVAEFLAARFPFEVP